MYGVCRIVRAMCVCKEQSLINIAKKRKSVCVGGGGG